MGAGPPVSTEIPFFSFFSFSFDFDSRSFFLGALRSLSLGDEVSISAGEFYESLEF